MTPPTLVVLAAPGLGILDNWLPVLAAARERHPGWRIAVVVPERSFLADVDPDDTVVRLVDGLADLVVAPTAAGGWASTPSLVAARRLAASERAARPVLRAEARLAARRGARRPAGVAGVATGRAARAVLRALRPSAVRRAAIDLRGLGGGPAALCYDVYAHRKPSARAVLDALGPVPRFSLHHGLDVVVPADHDVATPEVDLEARAYLAADAERPVYVDRYGVPPERLRVVGVPRHDPAWVDRVVAASAARHQVEDGAVVVISRPPHPAYLPDERRTRAYGDLHRVVCEDLGLRLLVKPHPKERDLGAVRRALPAGTEGRTWRFTGAHPFHLARHARAAVTFHSGVAVDLVALGVPVVELIDVRGLAADRAAPGRDARGRPQHSSFRRGGMVLPADDATELRAALDRALADRDGVAVDLAAALGRMFPRPPDPVGTILADLAAALDTTPGAAVAGPAGRP